MGQIVGGAAKPKRCNLNKLSQLGTPAAGEHILVSSDNSMNAAGQGNFDAYIVGDGQTAAINLELHYSDNYIQPTEDVIAEVLVEFASYFNDGYMFKGILSPSDEIGDQINRVIYLAGKGVYENLNDGNTYEIEDGFIGVFAWDGTRWNLKKCSPTTADSSTSNRTIQYEGEHIQLKNQVSFIKHMELGTITGSNTYDGRQGCDAYGDYLFTFQKLNTTCQIYDLKTKQKVADVTVTGLPASGHNNTACFGKEKYDVSDTYPLLYITDEPIQVVRVQENNGVFTMSVVQQISNTDSDFNFFTDGNGYFWRTSYKIGWDSKDYVNDGIIFKKYALPSVQEGDVTVSDALDTFELPYIFCQQGVKIINGRAFVTYGNTTVINSIQIVDLTSHQQVAYITLENIAESHIEIEDVFVYGDHLGLCFIKDVYLIKFL